MPVFSGQLRLRKIGGVGDLVHKIFHTGAIDRAATKTFREVAKGSLFYLNFSGQLFFRLVGVLILVSLFFYF